MYSLLIADDERGIRETVREYFKKREFEIWEASDGQEALELIEQQDFDIVLLDVMMPKVDGFRVCRELRTKSDIPVVFLTARTAEEDQLLGFQMKADDYITKPFSLPVLHAKVRALIERNQGRIRSNVLETTGIRVNRENHEVNIDGKIVQMPPKVYALFVYLLENKNRILTREQILNHVWGDEVFCYDRTVDTTIKKLRRYLGERAGCIKTIIKVGYKLEDEEDE